MDVSADSDVGKALSAGRWWIDPARSTVEFQARNLWGLVTVTGTFACYRGRLEMSATPAIELAIETASLHTGNRKRDAHLRSVAFFDSDHAPTVRFTADEVAIDGGQLVARGRLTAAGRTISLDVVATTSMRGEEIEIDGMARANQRDLGMTYSPLGMIRTPSTLIVRGRLVRELGDLRSGRDADRLHALTDRH